jgi:adenylate cyclase
MGDIVNTASRIEYLNKQLKTGLLVSEEMVNQLNGFITREVGKFRVAGKVKPVVVHELLGQRERSKKKYEVLA